METSEFQELIWQKGRELYRDMPWRDDTRLYYVLVSEIMLQQTQVSRVIPKFNEFMKQFPSVEVLAMASLSDVLTVWSGLGYNRRAKFLHDGAGAIVSDDQLLSLFSSPRPEHIEKARPFTSVARLGLAKLLVRLPGVGNNTAGAMIAYSFNQPAIFIETNIRTVYFHHFFADQVNISDKEIAELLHQTIDKENPREFYWALMDYGAQLKTIGLGQLTKAKAYKKQSPLRGSLREIRGQVIAALINGQRTVSDLRQLVSADERFQPALDGLIRDGLVEKKGRTVRLARG
jgi:A/G-specific adenine glycosylase